MKREYAFAKKVNAETAEQILSEVTALDSVQEAVISEDGAFITIQAADDRYLEALTKTLNISSRFTKGQWVSFHQFIYD